VLLLLLLIFFSSYLLDTVTVQVLPDMDRSCEGDDDEMDLENLSGAELFEALMASNASKRHDVLEKMDRYRSTSGLLSTLSKRTRHSIMAPVCGGLAYLDAFLIHTNELIVLLGDQWFAERSASQAMEIVDRRLSFLATEEKVLDRISRRSEVFLWMISVVRLPLSQMQNMPRPLTPRGTTHLIMTARRLSQSKMCQ
jgi:prefoldin subunit 5